MRLIHANFCLWAIARTDKSWRWHEVKGQCLFSTNIWLVTRRSNGGREIDGGTVSARFGREIKAGDQVTVVFDPKNPRKSAIWGLAQSCSTGSAYDVCQ